MVDVLALHFDIIHGNGAAEDGEVKNKCRTGLSLEKFAFFEFAKRYPVVAIRRPDGVNRRTPMVLDSLSVRGLLKALVQLELEGVEG